LFAIAAPKKRAPEQLKLLKAHPPINQLNGGSLYLYDRTYKTKHEAELKVFAEKAAEIRKRKPVEEFVPVLREVPSAAFLKEQAAHFAAHPVKPPTVAKGKEASPTTPEMQALATFCQALLTANSFLYVD
jgi:hypothetical protein